MPPEPEHRSVADGPSAPGPAADPATGAPALADPTAAPAPASAFTREHAQLDAQLRAHLLALVDRDFTRAVACLRDWHAALLRHIAIEDTVLFPQIPATARWPAKVYLAEHALIRRLADAHVRQVLGIAGRVPPSHAAQVDAALQLLDAAHPLRHVLEHHHAREETALAVELSAALLQRAWPEREPHGTATETEPSARR